MSAGVRGPFPGGGTSGGRTMPKAARMPCPCQLALFLVAPTRMRSLIVAFFLAAACATASADNLNIPLNDLGPRPYRLGYFGGLYENGSNAYPADHLAAGL